MEIKYIFLCLSIFVIFIVFYRQYNLGYKGGRFEYMTDRSNDEITKCDNDYSESTDLPLREYFVKSCFNSAYDGTDVSTNTIQTRIKEGYRFIDLNVFSASGDIYVGYSPDNAPKMISNKLLLSDALKCISENAFSKTSKDFTNTQMTDIGSYPIFVHIRVYRDPKPDTTVDIISRVSDVITGKNAKNKPQYTSNYLVDSTGKPTRVNGCTNLSSIMGKMVFSMDILNILEIYAPQGYQTAVTLPENTKSAMKSFVNILTGGNTWVSFYRYTEETLVSRTTKLGIGDSSINGSMKTNVRNLYISFPHPYDVAKGTSQNASGIIQPNIMKFIFDRSIQFIPVRAYLADPMLKTYTDIFDVIGKPFAPMFHVYKKYVSTANI